MRRAMTVLLAVGILPALIAAAPTGEPTVTDGCGGGSIPHLDICATWIAPVVNGAESEQTLGGLEFDLLIDGRFDDRQPGDHWAMFFSLDDACFARIMVFRDVTDAVGLSTELAHFCDGEDGGRSVIGREILHDTELNGRLLHADVSASMLDEVGIDLSLCDTLTNVYSLTWMGQSTSVGPQAVYTWDAPDSRGTLLLEAGEDGEGCA